jgi:hypothetical protein
MDDRLFGISIRHVSAAPEYVFIAHGGPEGFAINQ